MSQSDEDKCGECASFVICSRPHMGEWHVLNEKLVQMLLTHFYSTHDLDDRESVQTYCEHLHLFFTVHWLNRNDLLVLTHFKLKHESINSYRCVSHCPRARYRFQKLKLSLWTFSVLNPSLFLSHRELFSGFNLTKCHSYVWITVRDRIHIDGLLSWLDCLIGFGVTPCVTVPHADSLWSQKHAGLWYWERDMPLVSCLTDLKQAWTHIRGLFPFHIYLQHMCCIDRFQMLEAGPDGMCRLFHFLHWFLKDKQLS